MMADGVFLIDGERFAEVDSFPPASARTGWWSAAMPGSSMFPIAARTARSVRHTVPAACRSSISRRAGGTHLAIPGGGSPDMGNVSADGKRLWLAGRFDNVVYAIDTATGAVRTIP